MPEVDKVICSSDLSVEEWKRMMSDAVPMDYDTLKGIVREECPMLYSELVLDYPSLYESEAKQTATHYILCHSMKEYFIKK